jgi:hypothetical protein
VRSILREMAFISKAERTDAILPAISSTSGMSLPRIGAL